MKAIDQEIIKEALQRGGAPYKAVWAVREALRLYSNRVIEPLIKRVEELEAEVKELREFKQNRTGDGK